MRRARRAAPRTSDWLDLLTAREIWRKSFSKLIFSAGGFAKSLRRMMGGRGERNRTEGMVLGKRLRMGQLELVRFARKTGEEFFLDENSD